MAWLPQDVELVSDLAPTHWVVDAVDPWTPGRLRVSNFLPRRFDAYARIKHPPRDNLPEELLTKLLPALKEATTTADQCWFCLWDGYGFLWSRSHTPYYEPDANADEIQRYWASAREQDEILRETHRLALWYRSYFVFKGPLRAATFRIGRSDTPWIISPNLWWPDDLAWCVSSEIDAYSTNIGGSRSLIGEMLERSDLDTMEITPDTGMGEPYE